MKYSENIKYIIQKFVGDTYTSDELEQVLDCVQEDKHALLDAKMSEQWEHIRQWPGLENETERKAFKFEALEITRQSPVVPVALEKKRWHPGDLLKIAASLTVIIAVTSCIYWFMARQNETAAMAAVSYTTISTGYGEHKEITLADGSIVNLNACSELIFPEKFSGKTRKVELCGEAFFRVTPDSLNKFIVRSLDTNIEVLGTTFNVKDYVRDKRSVITVMSGKIDVTTNERSLKVLTGEQLYIDRKTSRLDKLIADTDAYSSWRKGELYFNRTPIFEVVKTLHRQYGVDIILEGDSTVTISGRHNSRNLDAVLESICFTANMKYRKNEDKIILYQYSGSYQFDMDGKELLSIK